jgi:hypothetical protein
MVNKEIRVRAASTLLRAHGTSKALPGSAGGAAVSILTAQVYSTRSIVSVLPPVQV